MPTGACQRQPMARGCGAALASPLGSIQTSSGLGGLGGSAPLSEMLFGAEVSSPSEDQGVRLAPAMMTPNDKVPAATHGPELSHGVPTMHKGNGGLPAPVLHLPPGPGGMTSYGQRATGNGHLVVTSEEVF